MHHTAQPQFGVICYNCASWNPARRVKLRWGQASAGQPEAQAGLAVIRGASGVDIPPPSFTAARLIYFET